MDSAAFKAALAWSPEKPWYYSKGVLGGVASVVASGVALALQASPDQQHAIQTGASQVTDWIVQGTAIAASLVALYGRIKAKDRITLGGTPTPAPKEN